jgi:hypothetical protein
VYNVGTNDMPPGWQAKMDVLSQFTEEQRQEMAVQNALVNDMFLASDSELVADQAEISALINGCGNETIDCPFYETWKGMVQSCYDPYWLNDNPTDRDATVSEEWKSFSTFKEWMETESWEGKVLGFREPTSMIA